jgi:hypothetical protein
LLNVKTVKSSSNTCPLNCAGENVSGIAEGNVDGFKFSKLIFDERSEDSFVIFTLLESRDVKSSSATGGRVPLPTN